MVRKLLISIAVAILVAVGMTVLSAVPPLSLLYGWIERNDMDLVWTGIVAGVISVCLTWLWRRKK